MLGFRETLLPIQVHPNKRNRIRVRARECTWYPFECV
ncbi:hypothetical protein OH492_28615 [Vibrio chagasii]|nr:hypothetical protein [Vibrio chagasii]